MAPSPTTIAILTASSNSGAACVSALLSSPKSPKIHAAFRTTHKADAFATAHASNESITIFRGVDASRPETLAAPLAGASAALIVTPLDASHGMSDDAALTCAMLRAAAVAGVRHLTLVSSWTVRAATRVPQLARRFAPSEAALRELHASHGISWTVLRGGYFMTNFAGLAPMIRARAVRFADICVPANDPADIGRVAAAVLSVGGVGHKGKTYEISGPEFLAMADVVRSIASAIGEDVSFEAVPAIAATRTLPPFLQELVAYLEELGKEAVPISRDVLNVTGTPPVSLRDWAENNKALFMV